MSKKLLFIFILGAFSSVYSQLMVSATATPITCLNNYSTITATASGGTPEYTYSINGVTFYANNVFPNLVAGTYLVSVKDSENNTASIYITITMDPPLYIFLDNTNVSCFRGDNGIITVYANGGTPPYLYSLMVGPRMASYPLVSNTFRNLPAGMYTVQVTDAKQCTSLRNVEITQPTPLMAICSVTSDDTFGTLTVLASGGTPNYQYSIDGGLTFVSNNVFSGLQPGIYTAIVRDMKGCIHSSTIELQPTLPVINNPTQTFPQGATLADISVTGQNIKWYATQSGNRVMASELPLSTVLVDGTTYYVTQTVNGIESQRTGITVKVGTLSNQEVSFQQLKVFPIPAKEQLKISNATPISSVVIYNYLGTAISTFEIDSQNVELDITSLASGVYFAKLKTADAEKTVKFVKE